MSIVQFLQAAAPAAGAAGAGAPDPLMTTLIQLFPFVLIMGVFYFLLIRPQQKRMKAHQEMLSTLKRNDDVVLSSGFFGSVDKVDGEEVHVKLAQNVVVRVQRAAIAEIRNRTATPPANDAAAAKT